MKKVVGVLCVIVLSIVIAYSRVPESSMPQSIDQISPRVEPVAYKEIQYQNTVYGYSVVRADFGATVIFNTQKKDAEEVMAENDCSYGINGGFYDTNFRPLGLVVSRGDKISQRFESSFFDGYLTLSGEFASITFEPEERSVNALQSGPVLMHQFEPISLRILEDKPSRRSVAVVDSNNMLYALEIFNTDSVFSGPYLQNIPYIVQKIAQKEHIQAQSALNLDGGSSSMIKTSEVFLSEYKPVMSIICISSH